MTGELRLAEHLAVGGTDRRQGAAAESDEETLGGHIVPDVVRVLSEPNRPRRLVVGSVDELDPLPLAVCDCDELRVGNDGNALRLPKPGQTLGVTAALEVEHFDRVVSECRDVQSLRDGINAEMIDAALDARKIDRADEGERCLNRCGLKGDESDRRSSQDQSHDYSLPEFDAILPAPTSTSSANRRPLASSSAVPCFHTRMNSISGCSATVWLRMDVTVKSRARNALST